MPQLNKNRKQKLTTGFNFTSIGKYQKVKSNLKNIVSNLFTFILLFLITLSMTINPVAATRTLAAKSANAESKNTAQPSTALIPSTVFSNPAAINVPDAPGMATSVIPVAGMSGPISAVTVTLNNINATQVNDLDILLVGPGGQHFLFLSDVSTLFGSAAGVTLTLSDAAASLVTNSANLSSGTFRPTNYASGTDTNFPAPAPAAPYNDAAPQGSSTFASIFGGLSGGSVNGNWTLYVRDDSGGGTNAITGGWSLDITTTAAAPTTTVVTSSLNPSNTNQAVTFTATVTSSSTVNTGNVTFVDTTTGTTLCSNVNVNGSGVATCLAPANTLTERRHTIQATYNPNVTFATSNGSIVQTVNTPTVISGAGNTVFTNPGGITIPDAGPTTSVPYPSNILVSGLTGSISKVTLALNNASFGQTNDFNFLLVGPGGQTFVLMSDAGGSVASNGVTLTFDDAAGSLLPNSGSIATGTYRPTDYNVDTEIFPAPAPVGPYNTAAPNGSGTFASVYGGAAPNGTWSLYPIDDAGGGAAGTIGSWSLTFITSGDSPTTTVLTGNPNPSTTAQTVLFTATVTSATTVNVGTVTFRRGATILCATVPVNASGVATCNAGPFTQGDFLVTADYNGSPGQFNISSGSTTQLVNSPTVATCLNFANNGGITVSNTTTLGNPYPSRIIVTGLGGSISKVTLTMTIGSALTPDHNDFLLVAPNGQKFYFMGDAGGTTDIINQTITLDDAAATALPDSTAITTGTYRPAAYTGDSDTFPPPAPTAPYNPAAPEGAGTFALFNGISPNGQWQLYATEDAGDGADTVITNWSLTFTLAATATTTAVTSSVDPSVFGQPVTFTATVSSGGFGTPTGNIQFFDGATPIGGAVALNGSGVAQVTTSSLSVGNHTITAQYAGATGACTGTFNSSTGALNTNPQTVNQAGTTTSITSNQSNPIGTNVPVTYTATVNPLAPGAGTRTGTVTFNRNGTPVCSNVAVNGSGQATCTIAFSPPGNYNINAVYSGDTNFTASTSPTFVQQVLQSTAAAVVVSGRIVSQETGAGVKGARVRMTDPTGQMRTVITNPFGYYSFAEVASGEIYIFAVSAKGYQNRDGIVRTILDEVNDLDIHLVR